MNKDDLTLEQNAQRLLVIECLGAAGWRYQDWSELFESGVSLSPEVSADFENPTTRLRLGWFSEGHLRLELEQLDGPRALSFLLYLRGSLKELVVAIIAVQDRLSFSSYAGWIKTRAIPLCETVTLETPDGTVRLS